MALDGLIKDQTIVIDDHKRGSREVKNWDNTCNDIHIDKTTNFPIDGKRQKIRIRIPINSNNPIRIKNERKQTVKEIPRKLEREIQDALEDKRKRNKFVKDVLDVLKDFDTALKDKERANDILTRISKHFGLEWPKDTIEEYLNDILNSYTLVYEGDKGKRYFASLDKEKIELGQYSGYAKQFKQIPT